MKKRTLTLYKTRKILLRREHMHRNRENSDNTRNRRIEKSEKKEGKKERENTRGECVKEEYIKEECVREECIREDNIREDNIREDLIKKVVDVVGEIGGYKLEDNRDNTNNTRDNSVIPVKSVKVVLSKSISHEQSETTHHRENSVIDRESTIITDGRLINNTDQAEPENTKTNKDSTNNNKNISTNNISTNNISTGIRTPSVLFVPDEENIKRQKQSEREEVERDTKEENINVPDNNVPENINTVPDNNVSDINTVPDNNVSENINIVPDNINDINSLLNQINSLSDQNSQLSSLLSALENTNTTNNQLMDMHKLQYTNALVEMENTHKERETIYASVLSDRMKDVSAGIYGYISNINAKISNVSSTVAALPALVDSLSDTIASQKLAIDSISSKLTALEGDKQNLQLELDDLCRQHEINQESIKFITTEKNALQEKNEAYRRKQGVYAGVVENIVESIKSLSTTNVREEVESLKEEVREKVERYVSTIRDLEHKVSATEGECIKNNTHYHSEISRLQSEISQITTEHHAVVSDLNGTIDTLKKEHTNNTIHINTLTSDRLELTEELELKNKYTGELEGRISNLTKSNKYYQEEIIKADKIIQEIKNNRIAIDFSGELEKIKRRHNKEMGRMRMEIEELKKNK